MAGSGLLGVIREVRDGGSIPVDLRATGLVCFRAVAIRGLDEGVPLP